MCSFERQEWEDEGRSGVDVDVGGVGLEVDVDVDVVDALVTLARGVVRLLFSFSVDGSVIVGMICM